LLLLALLGYDIRFPQGCTFLLERKVPKEIAFLQADEVVLLIGYMAVTFQQPIPCYPEASGSSPPLYGVKIKGLLTMAAKRQATHPQGTSSS